MEIHWTQDVILKYRNIWILFCLIEMYDECYSIHISTKCIEFTIQYFIIYLLKYILFLSKYKVYDPNQFFPLKKKNIGKYEFN